MFVQNDVKMVEQPGVVLKTEGLTKQFSGVVVVNKVDLTVNKGKIHAIVGENGAGKSTLVKMIAGDLRPDGGNLILEGIPISFENPRHANMSGIAMVHQEMQLVPTLDVINNLMLVNPPDAYNIRRGTKAELTYVKSQLARVGLDINPKTPVSSLSVAQSQLLEIAKALCLNAKVIIFDEPTSALPPKEIESLLELIISLRNMGHAVIYISHHLSEVLYLADSITVMRDSNVVGNFNRGEITESDIIRLMVDRPVGLYSSSKHEYEDKVVLSAKGVSTSRVSNITLELHKGEILGFAGLLGSGMQEAAKALSGAVPIKSGVIRINSKQVTLKSPYDAIQNGIAYVPEDRKIDGIIPDASIDDNFHVGRFQQFIKFGLLDRKKMKKGSLEMAKKYGVHYNSIAQPIKSLSGGNQQKVVVGRCVQSNPQVLILSEPTRGIDVAAKDDIHRHILSLASNGTSIILISSELEEVLALSNRVAVFSEGQLVSILEKDQINPTNVMSLATPKRNNSNGEKFNEIH